MDKTELLKLVADDRQEDVKVFLDSMTDMSSITKDNANDFIRNNSVLLSEFDRKVTGGITKYKDESFEREVNSKVDVLKSEMESKYNPQKSDDQKRIDALEELVESGKKKEIATQQMDVAKAILKSQKDSKENDIDLSFFDASKMVGVSDNETTENVNKAIQPYLDMHTKNSEGLGKVIQDKVDEVLKGSHKPVKKDGGATDTSLEARVQTVRNTGKAGNLKDRADMYREIRENKNK